MAHGDRGRPPLVGSGVGRAAGGGHAASSEARCREPSVDTCWGHGSEAAEASWKEETAVSSFPLL